MIRNGPKRIHTQQHSRLNGKSNLKDFWNHHVLFRRILPRCNFCDRGLPLDAERSHETTESTKKLGNLKRGKFHMSLTRGSPETFTATITTLAVSIPGDG